MLELHCHTTCSDGTLTPEALVAAALQANVRALAITDHDTLAGWQPALDAARDYGLTIIPGVEVSTVYNGRSLHVLGYYPNRDCFAPCLSERLAGRHRRAQAMAERLAELGCPIQLPEMRGEMAPCRPHIARALVQAGHVACAQEAFERYIGEDKPAYVHYEKFSSRDGIAHLRRCGGVPVWAHPYLFRGGEVEAVLPDLVDAGLMGLEVYHPGHSPKQVRRLLDLCDRYGLLVAGGSDYHGPSAKGKNGTALNQYELPLALLHPIWEAALALQPTHGVNPYLRVSGLM
ncbi:MAG: PHP domain-containing protein [Elainellaceae cyanobacterium]